MEKYDNLGMVGEGSYGMVMKCKHKETGQIVAIKKFLESEDDKMVKKIAMREVRMLRKLRHENLVNLIEVFRRRKRLYLVFEFVDHTVLDDLEKYPNGLSEMTVRKILWQVLRGVEFCHSHNIIHRDIKPENILNSKAGVIKLCDFGFARTLASPGEVYTDYVATRWYRAPELLVGDTKYGRAVDIWAIGCLIGEMLQGDPIFPGKSDIDQLSRILRPVDIWAVGCLITEMLTGDPLFPGDSDIDQLYHIIRCFGNLCPRHREIFQRNPLFAGMRLPDVREVDPLEKKFPKFSSEVLDLMKQCLRLDPNDRPSSSMLLRHEFFKKDNFEEKVIPELRARILKDAANNMLTRKDSNKEQDREKRKKKNKEIISNTENQSTENLHKKSPDQKSLQNSPKKQEASNSPKKQDLSHSPKKQDLSNSSKKQDLSNSPKKQDTSSPKKDNIPKSILKPPSNSNVSTSDSKNHLKESDKNLSGKNANESALYSKHLPTVDTGRQASIFDISADTPRPAFKSSPKDKTNMPQIAKKRSVEELHSKSTAVSRDGSQTLNPNDEKIKAERSKKLSSKRTSVTDQNDKQQTEKSKKSSAKRDTSIAELSERQQQKSSDLKNLASKTMILAKVSSDSAISKEMTSNLIERNGEASYSSDKLYNSKSVPPPDYKHHKKEAFRKSPKQSESPTRQGSIPPILNQNLSKAPSPDVLGTPTSSTPQLSMSKVHTMTNPGTSLNKIEKPKKNLSIKKTDLATQQSTFDRSMYPDKTSHFEKMMLSMSSTTSISHPAFKKSLPAPTSQSHFMNSGITGSSGMDYHRHFREETKHPNLPIWSTHPEENTSSLHSSIESSYKTDMKHHRTSEDFTKPREKSLKQSKKENKVRHLHEEKHTRLGIDHKADSQITRLPDLGRKATNVPEFSSVKFGISDVTGSKTKKHKNKVLAGIPSLDVASVPSHHKHSRSPSPVNSGSNVTEGNFPSVYHRTYDK